MNNRNKEEIAYKVSAVATMKSKDLPDIRYGLEGKAVTIIGKKLTSPIF